MTLAHLTLATRDVPRAEAFFAATLGWRSIKRPNNIGRPAVWLEIAPGQELHLVEVADFAPSPFEAEFGRHVAIAIPLAEFDGLKRRLREHGVGRSASMSVADGYVFEVVAAERVAEAATSAN